LFSLVLSGWFSTIVLRRPI